MSELFAAELFAHAVMIGVLIAVLCSLDVIAELWRSRRWFR